MLPEPMKTLEAERKPTATGRILLVDDHPLFREGVVQLLERQPGLVVCGEAASAREAMAGVEELDPDLLLLDMNLPDRNGLEVVKDLSALRPNLPILVLSMHDESLYAERSIRAGARGYLMKDVGGPRLLEAVQRVLEGETVISDEIASRIFASICGKTNRAGKMDIERLTDRELQVLQLVGEGLNSHEIGSRLGISHRTVDAHRINIREKLGLADSMALTRYAVRWVEVD